MRNIDRYKIESGLVAVIATLIPVWTAWQLGAIASGRIVVTQLLTLWIAFLIIVSVPTLLFLVILLRIMGEEYL